MSIELEEEFRQMCREHDLTYEYSDDYRYYERGSNSIREIQEFAKKLGRNTAVRIWNEIVDSKLAESAREMFYWKV